MAIETDGATAPAGGVAGGAGDGPAVPVSARLHHIVAATMVLAAALAAVVLGKGHDAIVETDLSLGVGIAIVVVLCALSEVAYVRVPHGDSIEDLTFFEVVVVTATIVLPAGAVLLSAITGLAAACFLLRRPLLKTLFNIGTYTAGTSVILLVAHATGSDRLDLPAVLGLLAGTAAFAGLNLVALSLVLAIVEHRPPLRWLREEWATSALMVVGSVGVGTVAVQLAVSDPVLLPFVALPVLALMRSYRATQEHAEARERADALVALNAVLAARRTPAELADELQAPLRRLFRIAEIAVVQPGEQPPAIAGETLSVPLELEGEEGALLLGLTSAGLLRDDRPFSRRAKVDMPTLLAVASAVASVLRAARHLAALTEESSKLQAVIDHATDGIAVLDTTGEVLVWSPSLRDLAGDPPARLRVDQPGGVVVALLSALSTTPEETAAHLSRTLARAQARAKTPVTILGRHGDEREVDVSIARIGSGDDAGLVVVTVRDATQERRLEKMKADFVATVSHELKTPITPIKGYARLLASRGERMEPARRLHALQLIEDRADHLARLVDDLLLASRVVPTGLGKLKVDLADLDMRNVVRQATTAFPLLGDRLDVRISPQAIPVNCDLVRAVQCVANLVNNADKYSAEGTPIKVELFDEPTTGRARVVVTDRGRGIAPTDQERIFERFHRVEDPFTMQTSGSGLGLYIARELARAMGGDITVSSTVGEGSAFTFTLPRTDQGDTRPANSSVSTLAG